MHTSAESSVKVDPRSGLRRPSVSTTGGSVIKIERFWKIQWRFYCPDASLRLWSWRIPEQSLDLGKITPHLASSSSFSSIALNEQRSLLSVFERTSCSQDGLSPEGNRECGWNPTTVTDLVSFLGCLWTSETLTAKDLDLKVTRTKSHTKRARFKVIEVLKLSDIWDISLVFKVRAYCPWVRLKLCFKTGYSPSTHMVPATWKAGATGLPGPRRSRPAWAT